MQTKILGRERPSAMSELLQFLETFRMGNEGHLSALELERATFAEVLILRLAARKVLIHAAAVNVRGDVTGGKGEQIAFETCLRLHDKL